ncbi:PAP2 domain protein [Metarhizium rileyi]|uniref:PAP2 domain protein n=1 Tax=Metarhizium rileyi (strain RCEF 4871) TaxID=1649241 RepID=A0A167C2I9_METRR|nr:PAP2 domain protein [Metarhizium rileyi RCEF 4871]
MAPKLLVASYVSDWVVLIILSAAGFFAGKMTPNHRPFSLDNPNISLPYKGHDTVSIGAAIVISIVVPAILILMISLLSLTASKFFGKRHAQNSHHALRQKFWEWHAGWLGLMLSAIIAFALTNGTKNLLGKPRPNLLGRCQPDIAKLAEYVVSNATTTGGRLVSAAICTNKDKSVINEGFRSFPSGHSSAASSGLVYISLWLAAKLGVGSPFLLGGSTDRLEDSVHYSLPTTSFDDTSTEYNGKDGQDKYSTASAEGKSAAAPLYLLLVALLPVGISIYICASRWYDFQHHGLDIISGYLIGIASSIIGFRYYHRPLFDGAGFSWIPREPRHRRRAFWSYVPHYLGHNQAVSG